MKFARMVVHGVLADSPKDFKREKLLLQRAVDKGGDSVLITLDGNEGEKTSYIVPTQHLKDLLDEPLKSDGKNNHFLDFDEGGHKESEGE